MKILALDIGDVWTGTAISDALGFFARPYQTVKTYQLQSFLTDLFAKESIQKVVIGHPRTLRGTTSEQTKKVEESKLVLEQHFPAKTFILWDERLSSKKAQNLKPATSKEEKVHAHSVAAAFILEGFLQSIRPIHDID